MAVDDGVTRVRESGNLNPHRDDAGCWIVGFNFVVQSLGAGEVAGEDDVVDVCVLNKSVAHRLLILVVR